MVRCKKNELQQNVPFSLQECKINMLWPFLETDRDLYFCRTLEHTDDKQKIQTLEYFDFGVITVAQTNFQQMECSMKFPNTFYTLFSGQSKKVNNFIFFPS